MAFPALTTRPADRFPAAYHRAMRVAVAGSHGLIGSALVRRLSAEGWSVVRIVRPGHPEGTGGPGATIVFPQSGPLDPAELDGIDAVVNLAGAGIGDHRWTDEYRRTLVDSRIGPTTALADAIAASSSPPPVFVSASAVGYYGSGEASAPFDESSPRGEGFLAELVERWEEAAARAATVTRVVTIRSGIVLSPEGGVLAKLLPVFRFGLGGRFGDGRQGVSWISIDDEVSAIRRLITDGQFTGPVNLAAPHPVTNRELTAVLGRVLRRPTLLPVPRFAGRLALGRERADNLLFDGQFVTPRVLTQAGFTFAHPDLDGALHDLLGH